MSTSAVADLDTAFLLSEMNLKDETFMAMASGEILWGDLLCNTPSTVPPVDGADEPLLLDDDYDWVMPVLKLRKDIWENFPVSLLPIGTGSDGAERHAIVWHRHNLRTWREFAESYDVWMDYEDVSYRRLIKALESSKYWTVEPALADNQLCIIRMNFLPKVEAPPPTRVESPMPAPVAEKPANAGAGKATDEDDWTTVKSGPSLVLTCLHDIGAHFPAIWNEVPSKTANKVYAIIIHNKRVKALSEIAGRNVYEEKKAALLRALKASTAWRVLRAADANEVCRVELF